MDACQWRSSASSEPEAVNRARASRASAEKSGERQKSMSSRSSASTRPRRGGERPGNPERDRKHTVLVAVEQRAGPHRQTTDRHRLSDPDQVVVGVRDGNGAGECLEPDGPHLGQVAHGAVRDHGDAPQCGEDRSVDLTPVGTHPWWIIEILDDHEPGLRQLEDVLPEGRRRDPIPFGCTPHRGRRGVADPGAEVGEHAPHRPIDEPLVARPNVERLDAVGQRRRAERPQLVENRAVERLHVDRGTVPSLPGGPLTGGQISGDIDERAPKVSSTRCHPMVRSAPTVLGAKPIRERTHHLEGERGGLVNEEQEGRSVDHGDARRFHGDRRETSRRCPRRSTSHQTFRSDPRSR